jgi:hypothetical protein
MPATSSFWQTPRTWVVAGVVVLALLLLHQLWIWEVERVEVPPGHFVVLINLWGKDLPEGEILAPDKSYRGIQQEVLSEGRHFINPLFQSYQIEKMVEVPADKCLVLTRKFGMPIAAERAARGDFLAHDGERGLLRDALPPGRYRLNPYGYDWKLVDAVKVAAAKVGVSTLKVGPEPPPPVVVDAKFLGLLAGFVPPIRIGSPYVAPDGGYRGVQARYKGPATYYLNPSVEEVAVVDVQEHTVEFTDIDFPTADGFQLRPRVRVVYKVLPDQAPELFVMLSDEGKLEQGYATPQEVDRNPILQKVVLPLIRGYVRIEGSKYPARDYLQQSEQTKPGDNFRERLQKILEEKVRPRCEDMGVVISSITILDDKERAAEVQQMAALITERRESQLKMETNKQKIAEAIQKQETKASEALVERERKIVDATTEFTKTQTLAEQRKENLKAELEQALANAELRLTAAKSDALAMKTKAEAEAEATTKLNKAQVAGLRTAVQGFATPEQYAQAQVLAKLAPALTEIFASDQSEFAKLFAAYMAPPRDRSAAVKTNGDR